MYLTVTVCGFCGLREGGGREGERQSDQIERM